MRTLEEVVPAVTCTAQASILTGRLPQEHGIVGNGWLFRDTGEVRFWQQSNALLQAEPIYATARRHGGERGRTFRAAKLFWWFNQGADVAISVTPKPHYGADGNKVFGITGTPDGLCERLEARPGPLPVPHLLGTRRRAAVHASGSPGAPAEVLRSERPDLTLVYLPHLDYDPQRFGPSGCDMARLVGELDDACAPLLDAARRSGRGSGSSASTAMSTSSRPIYRTGPCGRPACWRSGRARSARCSTPSAARRSPSATISSPTFTSPDRDDRDRVTDV